MITKALLLIAKTSKQTSTPLVEYYAATKNAITQLLSILR
jgi:hypothetical protein